MTLQDFIRDAANYPTGKSPGTLQDLADRRVALDSLAAATTSDSLFTPRSVWRLAWLSMRQVHLVAPLLPLRPVTDACRGYADALCEFTARLHRELPHDTPQPTILSRYFAESADFWESLGRLLSQLKVGPLHWIEHDIQTLEWVRLCTFYACATVTASGRVRSRREVADILANALTDQATPNTIRLRFAPAIERDLQIADRWAGFCAAREIATTALDRFTSEDPPVPARGTAVRLRQRPRAIRQQSAR